MIAAIKYPTSNAPFGSAYEEHAAIKDTAAEVRALRKTEFMYPPSLWETMAK